MLRTFATVRRLGAISLTPLLVAASLTAAGATRVTSGTDTTAVGHPALAANPTATDLAWAALSAFPDTFALDNGPVTQLVCPSASTCAALGARGANQFSPTAFFLVTTDGGNSWTPRHSLPFAGGASSEACPSTTTCYVVSNDASGAPPAAYKTTDLGQTWTTQPFPPVTAPFGGGPFIVNANASRIACPSTTTCIEFGAKELVPPGDSGFLVTTDGGLNWQPIFTPLLPIDPVNGLDVTCPTTTTCFFDFFQPAPAGTNLQIIRSQDGGQTWGPMTAPPAMTFDNNSGLTCPTDATCYLMGTSSMIGHMSVDTTTDGGATWTGPTLLRSNALDAGLSCITGSTCYAPFNSTDGTLPGGVLATTDGWATSTVEPLPAGVITLQGSRIPLEGGFLACPEIGVCYAAAAITGNAMNPLATRQLMLKGVTDAVPPSVAVAKVPVAVTSPSVSVHWAGSDAGSGVASYDVRYERAAVNGGFGPWVTPAGLQATRVTSTSLGLAPGFDYCVEIRARDHAGNVSGWFGPRCVARALDDRSLSTRSGWVRRTGKGYYFHTFTSTTKNHVVLTRRGARLDRLGVVATRCASCGAVAVFVGSKLIGTISLARSVMRKQQILMLPRFAFRTGTITIRTLTSGKTIEVDGLAVSRT